MQNFLALFFVIGLVSGQDWWNQDWNDPSQKNNPLETFTGLVYNRPIGGVDPVLLNVLGPVLRNGIYPMQFPADQLTQQQVDAITRYHQQRLALQGLTGVGNIGTGGGQPTGPVGPTITKQKINFGQVIQALAQDPNEFNKIINQLNGDEKLALVKFLNATKAAGGEAPDPTPTQQRVLDKILSKRPDIINRIANTAGR